MSSLHKLEEVCHSYINLNTKTMHKAHVNVRSKPTHIVLPNNTYD
jgi:hypothetical protein